MKETAYVTETQLQSLIAKYPSILAGDQMNPDAPRRWLLVTREMGVPDKENGSGRWSLDHLFLDQDAIPTLVEVKRACDTRIRREVIGQMMDYAANAVVYWPIEQIRAEYESRCEVEHGDADERIAALVECESDDEAAIEGYWRQVKTNLLAGRIRLVFVADEISKELRRIVEFLNGQTDPVEILAVELKQYSYGSQQTLVPRVLGQTAEAQGKKSTKLSRTSSISESEFQRIAKKHSSKSTVALVDHLTQWAKTNDNEVDFVSSNGGTCDVRLNGLSLIRLPAKHGRLVVQMVNFRSSPPFSDLDMQKQLQKRLENIPGFDVRGGIHKKPCFRLERMSLDDVGSVIQQIEWIISEVRRCTQD